MSNATDFTYPSIKKVMENESLSMEKKVNCLKEQLHDERAAQRAATESGMVGDNEQGARISELQNALRSLDADVTSSEDTKAATL